MFKRISHKKIYAYLKNVCLDLFSCIVEYSVHSTFQDFEISYCLLSAAEHKMELQKSRTLTYKGCFGFQWVWMLPREDNVPWNTRSHPKELFTWLRSVFWTCELLRPTSALSRYLLSATFLLNGISKHSSYVSNRFFCKSDWTIAFWPITYESEFSQI